MSKYILIKWLSKEKDIATIFYHIMSGDIAIYNNKEDAEKIRNDFLCSDDWKIIEIII